MTRNKILCPDCGTYISLSNITKHQRRHINHPETFVKSPYTLTHDDLFCKYCKKECKNANSLRNHERLCKFNPDNQIAQNGFGKYNSDIKNKKRVVWNKGLTKDTNDSLLKMSVSVKTRCEKFGGPFAGKRHSEETKRKIALSVAGNTHGNRSKKGYYKGFFCGSSYELVYVIYNIDHNIPFARCDRFYDYRYKGNTSRYFPDFELPDGTIVEIKGYHTELVDIKAASVTDRPIQILYRKDLEEHFNYVCSTYDVKESEVYKLYDSIY